MKNIIKIQRSTTLEKNRNHISAKILKSNNLKE